MVAAVARVAARVMRDQGVSAQLARATQVPLAMVVLVIAEAVGVEPGLRVLQVMRAPTLAEVAMA